MRSQDVRKVVLLVAGLPGVGKSTISRKVSHRTGAKIVDIDDFKRRDVDPTLVTSQIDPPEVRWNYYQKALEYVFSLFDTEVQTVVIDEVFHLNTLRVQVESLCKAHGVRVVWVEVRCSYETVEKRLRSKTREGHILSTEESLHMNLMFKEIFEKFPVDAENHLVIENEDDTDVDALIENILQKW